MSSASKQSCAVGAGECWEAHRQHKAWAGRVGLWQHLLSMSVVSLMARIALIPGCRALWLMQWKMGLRHCFLPCPPERTQHVELASGNPGGHHCKGNAHMERVHDKQPLLALRVPLWAGTAAFSWHLGVACLTWALKEKLALCWFWCTIFSVSPHPHSLIWQHLRCQLTLAWSFNELLWCL